MDLGQKIKQLREKKNLVQADLGLAVGAKNPRAWGNQIENGTIKGLKMKHAEKLGRLLDVDPLYFFQDAPDKAEEPLIVIEKLKTDPILNKNSKKEIIYHLTEENRALLRENAYLKSLLLKHKINVYNAENQNETV